MRSTAQLICASLFTVGALLAQNPPPGPEFGGPGGPGGPGTHGGPPVTGAPYSAMRTETHHETLAEGNTIQQTRTEKVYRDTDGRTRTESTMTTPSGTTRTMITIFDPVAGFAAHLNPAESTAMKMTLPKPHSRTPPASPAEHPADANAPQVTKADLGTQTVNGVAATGTKMTITVPAGAMGNSQPIVETREVWMSTALKVPVKATSDDPRRGTSVMQLTDIAPGPQDASLFTIPSSYTVKDEPMHRGPGGPGGRGGPGPDGPPPPPDGGSL
jgi:hypothetical protein